MDFISILLERKLSLPLYKEEKFPMGTHVWIRGEIPKRLIEYVLVSHEWLIIALH